MNDIRNIGTKREDAYWVNFVTSLAGHHVGELPYERMDSEVLDHTPTVILRRSFREYLLIKGYR